MDIAWGIFIEVSGVGWRCWSCCWIGACGRQAYGLEHALVLERWGAGHYWTCSFFCFGGGTVCACTVGGLKKNEHFSFPRA
ncbi:MULTISPECIES: hypothetical protein [unclassified Bartonella]|uniref:hypothetical protein n=1 Tax=unclassified Bartonella TaxID=2645622 RepID=UPI0035D0A89A